MKIILISCLAILAVILSCKNSSYSEYINWEDKDWQEWADQYSAPDNCPLVRRYDNLGEIKYTKNHISESALPLWESAKYSTIKADSGDIHFAISECFFHKESSTCHITYPVGCDDILNHERLHPMYGDFHNLDGSLK